MALADYAMSSGLEDLNDKEVMDMIQQQVADFSSLYPNYIRPSPSEATAYPIPSDDSQLSPNETMFNRVINRVSPSDPDGPNPRRGMFRVTPGREGESVYGKENFTFEDLMTEYLNQGSSSPFDPDGPNPARPRPRPRMLTPTIPSSPSPDPEDWNKWGGLGEFSNKSDSPPGEEPDKKDGGPTPWDVLAMGVGGIPAVALRRLFFNKKNGMFKDVFKNTEFKPWALDKFEDRMNEAPLVERWAAQMKEQIGWQYMTPDERKDYIKKNKKNKNNHIIMDYNMYRRR
jgi:hypothetical protein